MMKNKLFKIQFILFVSYLALTIFFLVGFHNSMYETFLPGWLGDFFMLFAAVYFVGGGFIIPIIWFIYVVYHYQVTKKMLEPQYESNTKEFICKQLFPLMVLMFHLINLVYLFVVDEFSALNLVHFFAFMLFIFSLFALEQNKFKKSWTVFFAVSGVAIILWLVDMVIGPEFKQALLNQEELIYGFGFQNTFYLIWIFTIALIGFAVVGFFYIPDQTKYRHLLLLVISLMILFLSIVRQLEFFSRAMVG